MVVVYKRFKDQTFKKLKPIKLTQQQMTLLADKARQYRRDLDEAEWNDELPSTIEVLRRRVEMIEIQIALGEKYDVPF